METRSPTPPLVRLVWHTLAGDLFARLACAGFVVAILLRVLPILSDEEKGLVSNRYSPFVFLILVLASFRSGLSRLTDDERQFWNDLSIAYGLWLAVATTFLFFPHEEKPVVVRVFSEAFFTLYYLALILAIERQPHLRNRWRSVRLERLLAWPSLMYFLSALLAYFLLVPMYFDRLEYDSYASSMCMYLALDFVVFTKLAYSSQTAGTRRWRVIYTFLACAFAVTSLTSLAETLETLGRFRPPWSTPWSFFWDASYVFLVLAARVRHGKLMPGEERMSEDRLEGGLPGPSGQTMISALAFPFIHFFCYTFGFLGDPGKPARELLVGWSLPVLGTIAFVQNRFLERRVESLWAEHARGLLDLRASEQDLRLMIERKHSQELLGASEERFIKLLEARRAEASFRRTASFLDRVRDAVLVLDADGAIRHWSRAAADLFGWEAEEAVGRAWDELLDEDDLDAVAEAREEAEKRGRFRGTLRLHAKDGRRLEVGCRFVRLSEDRSSPSVLVLAKRREDPA